jgi:hypothetical protein
MALRYIPAGDYFVHCVHISRTKLNSRVHIFDLSHRSFDQVRQVDEGHKAKWFMLCDECYHSKEGALHGAPYSLVCATREISLPG